MVEILAVKIENPYVANLLKEESYTSYVKNHDEGIEVANEASNVDEVKVEGSLTAIHIKDLIFVNILD